MPNAAKVDKVVELYVAWLQAARPLLKDYEQKLVDDALSYVGRAESKDKWQIISQSVHGPALMLGALERREQKQVRLTGADRATDDDPSL